uniref:Uncharacterized protein n=1 Tax=Arundo donax TaxID=35708 RepID=A0A0A9TU45_ARUDO
MTSNSTYRSSKKCSNSKN